MKRSSQIYSAKYSESFSYKDRQKLPLAENQAVRLAEEKIAAGDFAEAKQVLVDTWMEFPQAQENEEALLRLKEGFIVLYRAQNDEERVNLIASMPIMLLDGEVRFLAAHPHGELTGRSAKQESIQEKSNQDT